MATAREMTRGPGSPEVRLERLRAEEVAVALARAPIAWIPLGALEYPPVPVTAGRHSVELVLDLAGVTDASYAETVEFE